MDRYIGLDVHAQSTAVAVLSESGQQVLSRLVETSAPALVELLKSVPGTRRLILEEGAQSAGPRERLHYGRSITDACLSWEATVPVLEHLACAARKRRSA